MSVERRWQIRVEHILEAIGKISRYTAGLSEEAFASQDMAVDAVIRNFQVIGEAARHVPEDVQARYPEIPWSLMQGMRHILVHDYFSVKLDVVWRTAQQSLPPLVEPLKCILKDNP
jgi:uncharacterized protein with HEPN domain